MDYAKVFEIIEDRRNNECKVEYKDENGEWLELHRDYPIRLLYECEIRIAKK